MTLALLALGLLARLVRYALNFPLWGDEAFLAVNLLLRDFQGMIDPLVYGQIAPLGFMWIELAVTKIAGTSEWSMRFVPVVSGLLTLILFRQFVRSSFGPAVTMLAVGFLAASYYPIRHAVEVKPYATDLLVSLLLTISGWAVCRRPSSIARWIGLGLLGGLSVWCSYPAAFIAGAVAVTLFCSIARRNGRKLVLGTFAYSLVLAASFSVMYFAYAKPHADATSELKEIGMWSETFPPLAEPWYLPGWFLRTHAGNMLAYPMGGTDGGSSATLILVIAGAAFLWRADRNSLTAPEHDRATESGAGSRRSLLLLLLSPLAFNFVAASVHAYPYGGSARTSLFMAPAFCLLAAIGAFGLIGMLPHPHRQRGIRILGGVLGAIAIGCMVRDFIEPYKKPETRASREAVRELAKQVDQGDQVIVFLATEGVLYAPFIGDAKGMGAQLAFYLMDLLPVELDDFAPPPEQVKPARDGQTWFIVFQRVRKGLAIFSERELASYLRNIERRLGPHEPPQQYILRESKDDRQQLEAYRFRRNSS